MLDTLPSISAGRTQPHRFTASPANRTPFNGVSSAAATPAPSGTQSRTGRFGATPLSTQFGGPTIVQHQPQSRQTHPHQPQLSSQFSTEQIITHAVATRAFGSFEDAESYADARGIDIRALVRALRSGAKGDTFADAWWQRRSVVGFFAKRARHN